jgi:hypothetical protein
MLFSHLNATIVEESFVANTASQKDTTVQKHGKPKLPEKPQ